MYQITSEIYAESDNGAHEQTSDEGRVVTKFHFHNFQENDINDTNDNELTYDSDGDLIRQPKLPHFNAQLSIEHHKSTDLRLVGLQVWRGALLLADYLYSERQKWRHAKLLELGAGVGVTSIAAAIMGQQVVCTDINVGGLLQLLETNVRRHMPLMRGSVKVLEYDFMQPPANYGQELQVAIDECDLVAAGDVIYDNELTDALIGVLTHIFEREAVVGRQKVVLMALEKRYVFTLADMESVPPMFEYFLAQVQQHRPMWRLQFIPTEFPQYFDYKRSKHLVLFQITSGCNYKK